MQPCRCWLQEHLRNGEVGREWIRCTLLLIMRPFSVYEKLFSRLFLNNLEIGIKCINHWNPAGQAVLHRKIVSDSRFLSAQPLDLSEYVEWDYLILLWHDSSWAELSLTLMPSSFLRCVADPKGPARCRFNKNPRNITWAPISTTNKTRGYVQFEKMFYKHTCIKLLHIDCGSMVNEVVRSVND